MKVRFYKAESVGNDFIVIPAEQMDEPEPRRWIPLWCDRHKGIGADGVILLTRSADPPRFRIFNADGSEAEISGNGLRCASVLLFRESPDARVVRIQTRAGIHSITRGQGDHLEVEMGILPNSEEFIPVRFQVNGRRYNFVHTQFPGNPHTFCHTISDESLMDDFPVVAPLIARKSRFPNGTNVEFVHSLSPSLADIRVWERGIGETLSCGSGAAAITAFLWQKDLARSPIELRFPGGSMLGDVRDGRVFVSAPARLVFEGEVFLNS